MKIHLQFDMNEKLYLKNPEGSELGRKIVVNSIRLIYEIGFEKFNFKRLSAEVETTEAGIYRYFGNKHKLLIYLTNWYWNWLEYQIQSNIKSLNSSEEKLKKTIGLICSVDEQSITDSEMDEVKLHKIIIREGTKTYLTQRVEKDNQDKLFKPYKDLCALIANIIRSYDEKYKYSHSLASTLIEIAHFQTYFKKNLPALTDFNSNPDDHQDIIEFLEMMVFGQLDNQLSK